MGSSRIIINSIAGKAVHLKRGVRQGDPISPYLFNLAIDFLLKWIKFLAELNFLLPPFPQCNTCLLYADDTLLFLRPDRTQIVKTKLLLDIFRKISGLNINLQKSKLLITSSPLSLTQNLASTVQCKPAYFPIKYLGLPLSDRRLKRADYSNLIERIQVALAGWKASLLSIGGCIILVNAVLSAIPQYFMSMFMLPIWVIKKIDRIRRTFLWHGHKDLQS